MKAWIKIKIGIVEVAFIAGLICQSNCYAETNSYIVKLKSETIIPYSSNDYIPLIPEIGLYEVSDLNNINVENCAYIEKNEDVELFGTYDYSNVLNQDKLRAINIEPMWSSGVYGADIRIGVIDSGCNLHPALNKTLDMGYNYAADNKDFSDNIGHGTAVSGIAGARYGQWNMIGTAHKSTIIPLKFVDVNDNGEKQGGTVAELINAIRGGTDTYNCQILNISAGLKSNKESLKEAVDYATEHGVVIVAAVGNDGNNVYNYPAAYENVIGVGSVNDEYQHSVFSNQNNSVFVVSPSENIISTTNTCATDYYTGTSFAVPSVAGIVADLISVKPDMGLAEIKNILMVSATDMGEKGWDSEYGYGIINAGEALKLLLKDKQYYISSPDLCSEDGFYELRITLRKDVLLPTGIWGVYLDNMLVDVDIGMDCIENDTYIMRHEDTGDLALKYFVWETLNNMKPIQGGIVK